MSAAPATDDKVLLQLEVAEAYGAYELGARELRKAMRRASDEGLTLREIAEVTSFSKEWVRTQLAPERPAPEWRAPAQDPRRPD